MLWKSYLCTAVPKAPSEGFAKAELADAQAEPNDHVAICHNNMPPTKMPHVLVGKQAM